MSTYSFEFILLLEVLLDPQKERGRVNDKKQKYLYQGGVRGAYTVLSAADRPNSKAAAGHNSDTEGVL